MILITMSQRIKNSGHESHVAYASGLSLKKALDCIAAYQAAANKHYNLDIRLRLLHVSEMYAVNVKQLVDFEVCLAEHLPQSVNEIYEYEQRSLAPLKEAGLF